MRNLERGGYKGQIALSNILGRNTSFRDSSTIGDLVPYLEL